MKNTLVISDYIEGKPVVASVRYTGIIKYLKEEMKIIVINNEDFGEYKSEFSEVNYKYYTKSAKFTQDFSQQSGDKVSIIERLMRNSLVLSGWRTYKYSQYQFDKRNQTLYKEIDRYLEKNKIDNIFVTVPDVYGLYILRYIKTRYPDIPTVVEVRDILNHKIGKGNPVYTYKKAEKLLLKYADKIITLSQGIYNHYREINSTKNMIIIRNGYDHELFIGSEYKLIEGKKEIILAHVGSIYKGRNIKDFIIGLLKFNHNTGIKVTFNIVGILDKEAFEDIRSVELNDGVQVNVVGSLPHEEAVQYLKDCDISVLITHRRGSGYAIPGKVFEYIGACKPILAVTKDIELVSLIQSKYGECAEHSSIDVSKKLLKIINSTYDFSDRLNYSRMKQAKKIIEVMNTNQTKVY